MLGMQGWKEKVLLSGVYILQFPNHNHIIERHETLSTPPLFHHVNSSPRYVWEQVLLKKGMISLLKFHSFSFTLTSVPCVLKMSRMIHLHVFKLPYFIEKRKTQKKRIRDKIRRNLNFLFYSRLCQGFWDSRLHLASALSFLFHHSHFCHM